MQTSLNLNLLDPAEAPDGFYAVPKTTVSGEGNICNHCDWRKQKRRWKRWITRGADDWKKHYWRQLMSNEHTPAQRLVQRMFNCTKPDCEICQARVRMIEAEYSAEQRIVEAARAFVAAEIAWFKAVDGYNAEVVDADEMERQKDAAFETLRAAVQGEKSE